MIRYKIRNFSYGMFALVLFMEVKEYKGSTLLLTGGGMAE
jgi:hypothetical protein